MLISKPVPPIIASIGKYGSTFVQVNTLLGNPFTLIPEFVTAETVNEFQLKDYVLENINRFAIFSEDTLPKIKDYVVQEMERIDSGFSFGKSVIKEEKIQASKKG